VNTTCNKKNLGEIVKSHNLKGWQPNYIKIEKEGYKAYTGTRRTQANEARKKTSKGSRITRENYHLHNKKKLPSKRRLNPTET
jgi:serine protease inhibitor ecotin